MSAQASQFDYPALAQSRVSLLPAHDDVHRWLLGRRSEPPTHGLLFPEGGIAGHDELEEVWAVARRCRDCRTPASWLIVADRTAIGLVGYREPPRKKSEVEIGYRVAEHARGKGYARAGVRMVAALAERDNRLTALTARTQFGNVASERVLRGAGFLAVDTRLEPEFGAVRLWRRPLR